MEIIFLFILQVLCHDEICQVEEHNLYTIVNLRGNILGFDHYQKQMQFFNILL